MINISVFGANGPTGRLLVRQALDEGHQVTAFTRHPDTFPIQHDSLRIHRGDVADSGAVEKAVVGQDAVLSTLGVPFSKHPIDVYSVGATNILAAMRRVGVHRLVVVSSTALEESPAPVGGFVFRKVLQPMVVNRLGRTLYADQRRMEDLVTASDMEWTIIRPSGLFGAGSVSDYEISNRFGAGRFTSREDLADCMLREVTSIGHPGRIIAPNTTKNTPGILSIIWNEGIKKH